MAVSKTSFIAALPLSSCISHSGKTVQKRSAQTCHAPGRECFARLKPMINIDHRCAGFGAVEELEVVLKTSKNGKSRYGGGHMTRGGYSIAASVMDGLVQAVSGRNVIMHPGF